MTNTVRTNENKLNVVFVGVDEFNQATFMGFDNKFYCDIYSLVRNDIKEDEIIERYGIIGTAGIVYKGERFNSEPAGIKANVAIISREEAKELLSLQAK